MNPFLHATRISPCIAGDPAQFAATFFPAQHDAHVKAWYAGRQADMYRRASDDMAAAIAKAGSVRQFLVDSLHSS